MSEEEGQLRYRRHPRAVIISSTLLEQSLKWNGRKGRAIASPHSER